GRVREEIDRNAHCHSGWRRTNGNVASNNLKTRIACRASRGRESFPSSAGLAPGCLSLPTLPALHGAPVLFPGPQPPNSLTQRAGPPAHRARASKPFVEETCGFTGRDRAPARVPATEKQTFLGGPRCAPP